MRKDAHKLEPERDILRVLKSTALRGRGPLTTDEVERLYAMAISRASLLATLVNISNCDDCGFDYGPCAACRSRVLVAIKQARGTK